MSPGSTTREDCLATPDEGADAFGRIGALHDALPDFGNGIDGSLLAHFDGGDKHLGRSVALSRVLTSTRRSDALLRTAREHLVTFDAENVGPGL